MAFSASKIALGSPPSNPKNFLWCKFNACKDNSGLLSTKLTTSWLPTLAPDGAHALPRCLLSVVTSISMDRLPLLLKTILPLTEVMVDKSVLVYLWLDFWHAPSQCFIVRNHLIDCFHTGNEHPPAAVFSYSKGVHNLCRIFARFYPIGELQILISNYVSTCKASHWNQHTVSDDCSTNTII